MGGRGLAERSKRLAWLLRHGAREAGLAMDAAGFADVEDVLRLSGLSREELARVVEENAKSRYEVRGERVRAVQGHSPAGTPVTLEGLEASWEEVAGDAPLFHGTSVAAARAILTGEGVHAAARSHVHLAPAPDATVGKRAGVDVLLEVSPARLREAGVRVFRAPNGVLLCRHIPREALTAVRAAGTRAGAAAQEALAALLVR
jgi:putative RNA 2'-phosphotransferase